LSLLQEFLKEDFEWPYLSPQPVILDHVLFKPPKRPIPFLHTFLMVPQVSTFNAENNIYESRGMESQQKWLW
jgi:hypothetical protein